jgi:hypothetical protein
VDSAEAVRLVAISRFRAVFFPGNEHSFFRHATPVVRGVPILSFLNCRPGVLVASSLLPDPF